MHQDSNGIWWENDSRSVPEDFENALELLLEMEKRAESGDAKQLSLAFDFDNEEVEVLFYRRATTDEANRHIAALEASKARMMEADRGEYERLKKVFEPG